MTTEQDHSKETRQLDSQAVIEKKRAIAIEHALEVKSAFEMYAYRIVSHEQFIERIDDLILYYKSRSNELNL